MCFSPFSTVLHSSDFRYQRCTGFHYFITFATIHVKKCLFTKVKISFSVVLPNSETSFCGKLLAPTTPHPLPAVAMHAIIPWPLTVYLKSTRKRCTLRISSSGAW